MSNKGTSTCGICFLSLREFDNFGHFWIVLISFRRALYENKDKYLNLKGKFYGLFLYGLPGNSLLLNKPYHKI